MSLLGPPPPFFPVLITRELLNDSVSIDHSSAKHRRTVWLVGQARRGHAMIFFFFSNFPHSSFIPFYIPERKAPTQQYSPLTFLYFHLPYISFNFSPIAFHAVASRTSFAIFTDLRRLGGCECALFCQPGAYAIFSQQIIAQ